MAKKLFNIAWEEFSALPLMEKIPYLMQPDGVPYHTLFAQQFDSVLLDKLAALANEIRAIAKTRIGSEYLRQQVTHKRAMLYFSQPSSRTFLSLFRPARFWACRSARCVTPPSRRSSRGNRARIRCAPSALTLT